MTDSTSRSLATGEIKQVTRQEAAHNVLVALTLQIRARTEELASGRNPLVLSEKVVHLIEKTRLRYVGAVQQQQNPKPNSTSSPAVTTNNNNATSANPSPTTAADGTEIKKYVPTAVSKALFDELAKISFLLVLGRVKGSTFAEQAREEEEASRRAAALRQRAQDQLFGGVSAGGGGGTTGLHGGSGPSQGKTLCFAAFPNLVNVAFFGCHIRKLEALSRVARFSALDTEVPSTAAMPLLSVFAALRHVEFDLELGMISPIVEQLSSFCFSLRSVSITITETPGANERSGGAASSNQAATAVTMNRRLFADVWRPKGAQVKLLGATQKKSTTTSSGTNAENSNNNSDPSSLIAAAGGGNSKQQQPHDASAATSSSPSGQGFWEALTLVKIKGDLSRRREGRVLAIIMLDDSWRGLKQVTSLSLRGLRFTSFLELSALQSLVHLRDLDLGDNCFSSISGAADTLPRKSLLSLRLDSNKITGGLAELTNMESLTALDISVNAIAEWTELLPLASFKSLRSLDVRANSLDARAPHERESVINAEDVVSVILRVLNHLSSLSVINGFSITSNVRTASETPRIKKNVEAILSQERANHDLLSKANLKKRDGGNSDDDDHNISNKNNNNIHGGYANRNIANSDGDDSDAETHRRTYTAASQSVAGGGGGGGRKKKRVLVKGLPTRIVQIGDHGTNNNNNNNKTGLAAASSSSPGGGAGTSFATNRKGGAAAGGGGGGKAGKSGAAVGDNDLYAPINQTGLDYLRATFGEQYLMHLPQHEFPVYIDPNDPNAGQQRNLSYEQVKNEIGVAAVVGDKLDGATREEAAAKALAAAASLKRTPIVTPVQPVFDQFLSEIRRHEWYPLVSGSGGEARQKIFPVGCEMMMSQVTFENACFWETPLFPPAKQTSCQPYAVHPEGREICLVNGADKTSKANETHLRFFRKVLFRVVETQVGFTRHIRLEERNLTQLPNSYFQQTPRSLAEIAGPQCGVIRAETPALKDLINVQTATGVTQEQLDGIPSFTDHYPIFQCVLPSEEHTPPIQISPRFFGVSKARGGGMLLGRSNNARGGGNDAAAAAEDDDDTVSVAKFSALSSPETTVTSGSGKSGSSGGAGVKLFGSKIQEMGIDEMAELSRHRVFGTGEPQLLAGFVVPAKMAAEFKRRLVQQLKTAAAKLSVQGVFREWPFVVRGEGSGEQRDASVPIEPTGKYLHDRIQQVSPEPESLSRQRIGDDVGASDQELSLRLRRFVFEKQRKFSTEAIAEFDFVSYFNALSPDSMMWIPNQEKSLIVGLAGPCLFCAEDVDTIDHHTGLSTANSPEEHFAHPRRYDLVNLRAIICTFDLSTIRMIFAPAKGETASSPSRLKDLVLVSREPRISLQFLAALVRLQFLPDSPAIVGSSLELQQVITNLFDTSAKIQQAQIFFRPTNIGRFTSAPFIYVAHVFFKTTDPLASKKPSVLNSGVYPMRCVHAINNGWACARLVITAKDMRLVEVREKTTANPEVIFNRSKKQAEEPFSVDIKQPSQLLRLELAPESVFPLLFGLVFATPSAPRKESEWILCAPHPSTLFSIRRELRNVQRQLSVAEMDTEAIDDFAGFPAPVDRPTSMSGSGDATTQNVAMASGGGGAPTNSNFLSSPRAGGGAGSPRGTASPRSSQQQQHAFSPK